MADLRPFRALRPRPDVVARVLAPPYDVVSTAEAAALAGDEPLSLLHVTRPEIDLPAAAAPEQVHAQGRAALDRLVADGVLHLDDAPHFLAYRLVRQGRAQTGVVGCAAVADYLDGTIAVHERTRADKEADRVAHLAALDVHDEPVFLMYPGDAPGADAVADVLARTCAGAPLHDVTAGDDVRHVLWAVTEDDTARLQDAFTALGRLYVADGHHRSAAAAIVAGRRPDLVAAQVFPVVVFPADELTVLPYHRVVADLGGHDAAAFLDALTAAYDVEAADGPVDAGPGTVGVRLPAGATGGWFRATLREAPDAEDPVGDPAARLDVALLTRHVLAPVLGIEDLRTDARIAFVGGARGTAELDRLVDSGEAAVAFSMPATSADAVMAVAAAGGIMPPKSTWFEPKLGSGLFLHPLA